MDFLYKMAFLYDAVTQKKLYSYSKHEYKISWLVQNGVSAFVFGTLTLYSSSRLVQSGSSACVFEILTLKSNLGNSWSVQNRSFRCYCKWGCLSGAGQGTRTYLRGCLQAWPTSCLSKKKCRLQLKRGVC